MSLSGAERQGTTELSRRLAVAPAATGAVAVASLVIGARLAGVTETESGQVITALAAALVTIAMASGFVVSHYLGLTLLAFGGQLGDEPRSTSQLILLLVSLVAVHELGRFSLDARHPTRFAPSFVRGFVLRATLLSALPVIVVVVAVPVGDFDLSPALVPIGLAMASLPLFTGRGVQALGSTLWSSVALRLAVGMTVALLTLGAAMVGAQARSGIVNDRATDDRSAQTDSTTPTASVADRDDSPTLDESFIEQVVSLAVLVLAIFVAGLLYAALRRPEVDFDLGDPNVEVGNRSLSLTNPGEANLDDSTVSVDEQDVADLFDGLLLDISSEPDPGRAIRYGYTTIERRLSELGIERQRHETEQELLARVLPILGGGNVAMARLTSLFESARFGDEVTTEALRHEAIEAIRTLRAALVNRLPGPAR